ncbi:Na/Pi symporter [Sutcliffiella cohnii]
MISIISLFAVFLAIFLFGMTSMRTGLYHLSENKLQGWLLAVTDKPWKGMLVGAGITAIIQSSSAVMVITIGLVAAGYLSFYQSIGVMLGTNIGTTITAELITFNIDSYIVPLLIVGVLLMISKKKVIFSIGTTLFGLGCLFVAMNGFEKLAFPLSVIPAVQSFILEANETVLFGAFIGTVLTAIIQSSTATIGISMSFLTNDILTIQTGIAIMLGANIGTCVTAILACIGSIKEAKLVAFAHVWLNVIGVLAFLPLINGMSAIVMNLASSPEVQLAHASLIFNVLCSVIALPLVKPFAKFVTKLHT